MMRSELRRLLRLALPILVTQLTYTAMAATDTVMAGRLGPVGLAAVGLGVALGVPVGAFIAGTLTIMTPAIAGHVAARRHGEAGRTAVHGAWLGLLLGALGSLGLWTMAPLGMRHAGVAPEIVEPALGYLRGLTPCLPFMGLWTAARLFCDGHSDTRPAMVTALCVAILNVPLNYLFMYPVGLGVAGIGLSSGLGFIVGAAIMTAHALRSRRYGRTRLRRASKRLDLGAVRRLFRNGAPVGLMLLGEYAALTAVAVFVGGLGAVALAAHQVAFNLTMTLFMIPMALSVAVSIRAGAAFATGDEAAAGRALKAGLAIGCGAPVLLVMAVIAVPQGGAALYSPDAAVQALAALLFVPAGGFLLFDAVQIVIAGYLRGRGEVYAPMVLMLAAHWLVGMPVGCLLSGPHGVVGWWGGLLCAVLTLAAPMAARVARGGADLSKVESCRGPSAYTTACERE